MSRQPTSYRLWKCSGPLTAGGHRTVPAIKGNTIVVLEQNAVLRLGIEALLVSWGCQVVSGDNLDDIIADTRADNLRPTVLLLPPTNGQETGDQLASRFEAEIGYPLPWIGITGTPAFSNAGKPAPSAESCWKCPARPRRSGLPCSRHCGRSRKSPATPQPEIHLHRAMVPAPLRRPDVIGPHQLEGGMTMTALRSRLLRKRPVAGCGYRAART